MDSCNDLVFAALTMKVQRSLKLCVTRPILKYKLFIKNEPYPQKVPFRGNSQSQKKFPDLFGVENRGLQLLICLVYPVHTPNGRKGEGGKIYEFGSKQSVF